MGIVCKIKNGVWCVVFDCVEEVRVVVFFVYEVLGV